MSRPERLAYDDQASLAEMHADCEAGRPQPRRWSDAWSGPPSRPSEPAPSIHFDDFPREVPKREIEISEAAARLANALHLHLD